MSRPYNKCEQQRQDHAMPRLILIIDAQVAFCDPHGSLAKAYGPDELIAIADCIARIESILATYPFPDEVILVRSEYRPGQFTDGDLEHAYAMACVTGANADCDWSLSPETVGRFMVITKRTERAASVPELLATINSRIDSGTGHILLGGFLATSCVRKTALDLRAILPEEVDVAIVDELVASRASSYRRLNGMSSRHEQALCEMKQAGVSMVNAKGSFT